MFSTVFIIYLATTVSSFSLNAGSADSILVPKLVKLVKRIEVAQRGNDFGLNDLGRNANVLLYSLINRETVTERTFATDKQSATEPKSRILSARLLLKAQSPQSATWSPP
jgi:hypothetical protein